MISHALLPLSNPLSPPATCQSGEITGGLGPGQLNPVQGLAISGEIKIGVAWALTASMGLWALILYLLSRCC